MTTPRKVVDREDAQLLRVKRARWSSSTRHHGKGSGVTVRPEGPARRSTFRRRKPTGQPAAACMGLGERTHPSRYKPGPCLRADRRRVRPGIAVAPSDPVTTASIVRPAAQDVNLWRKCAMLSKTLRAAAFDAERVRDFGGQPAHATGVATTLILILR